MAVGAVAALALLSARGGPTAVWVALPLGVWLLAAPAVSVLAAGAQVAVIVGLAAAADRYLGSGPSFWDAALAYDVMALMAVVAAGIAGRDLAGPDPAGRYPRPTPARRRLARAASVAGPVALAAVGCLAAVVALPVTPPIPPREIVLPLPDGVAVADETVLCGPGPTVTCTWSIDVAETAHPTDRVTTLLATHLSRTKGWDAATPRCRYWGWTIRERACVSIEVRGVVVVVMDTLGGGGPVGRGPVGVDPPGASPVGDGDRVVVVVTYR
jgi:hypothetical protein